MAFQHSGILVIRNINIKLLLNAFSSTSENQALAKSNAGWGISLFVSPWFQHTLMIIKVLEIKMLFSSLKKKNKTYYAVHQQMCNEKC